MNDALIKITRPGVLQVSGVLDLTTTPQLWIKSKALLNSIATPIQIDLQEVTQSDSSGVALLIAWQRYVRKANKKIQFSNLPKSMQAIIHVSELEKVLQF